MAPSLLIFPSLLLIYAQHERLAVGVCGLNFYERLRLGTTGAKSLICAGGLGINSPRRPVLRQPA